MGRLGGGERHDRRFQPARVLQPRELKPGENLLPKLYHTVPWERYQEPANPLWEDGLPRLWRWTGNRARSYYTPFSNFIDGDLETFSWQSPATHVGEEWYTIDVGAPVPAERFVIRMPDGVDRIGRPWAAYVPKAGELSASLTETAILGEGDRPNWWEYQPLETVLGGVNQNLQAPIQISFPLQYRRFFRWITYPEEILASGRKAIEALAYAEMELYGRGFAAEARYVTRVVDAARPVSIGRLFMGVSRWREAGRRADPVCRCRGRSRGADKNRPGRRPAHLFHLERSVGVLGDQRRRIPGPEAPGPRDPRPEIRRLAGPCWLRQGELVLLDGGRSAVRDRPGGSERPLLPGDGGDDLVTSDRRGAAGFPADRTGSPAGTRAGRRGRTGGGSPAPGSADRAVGRA